MTRVAGAGTACGDFIDCLGRCCFAVTIAAHADFFGKRAGADGVLTYAAVEAARLLNKG